MNTSDKKFGRAFVAQNSGHDFSELKALCDEIVFITSAYDKEDALLTTIINGLQNFSPRRDVIVPVGNVFINLLVGMVVAELAKDWGYYKVALYREKEYHIHNVTVSTVGEMIDVFRQL